MHLYNSGQEGGICCEARLGQVPPLPNSAEPIWTLLPVLCVPGAIHRARSAASSTSGASPIGVHGMKAASIHARVVCGCHPASGNRRSQGADPWGIAGGDGRTSRSGAVANALAACKPVGRSPPSMGDDVRRTHEPLNHLTANRNLQFPDAQGRLSPDPIAKLLHDVGFVQHHCLRRSLDVRRQCVLDGLLQRHCLALGPGCCERGIV